MNAASDLVGRELSSTAPRSQTELSKRGFMVSIEETNRNKLGNPRRPDPGKGTDEMPQKIIDFESGRIMLEKAWLEKEQIRARLVKRSRLPGSLPDDWLEFSLTIAMFFALLLGFYAGLNGSFRF